MADDKPGDYSQKWLATLNAQPLLITGGSETTRKALVTRLVEQAGRASEVVRHDAREDGSIKEIRGILDLLTRRSWQQQRLVIIDHVEDLSWPAVTALLKALEEPGQTTKWLLTSAFARRIMPTIVSRCQRVYLPEERLAPRPPLRQLDADFTPEDLESLVQTLSDQLRKKGPTVELRRAFYRLRDLYRIQASAGNAKLAREVLVASLPELRY